MLLQEVIRVRVGSVNAFTPSRMPAAMFGDAIKRHVQTRQTALAETAALHAERATNERECGSTHAGLGGHDANTGQEGSSARSVDDDEQDVDDHQEAAVTVWRLATEAGDCYDVGKRHYREATRR